MGVASTLGLVFNAADSTCARMNMIVREYREIVETGIVDAIGLVLLSVPFI